LEIGGIAIGLDGDDGKGRAEISSAEHLGLIDQVAIALAGIEAQALFEAPTHDFAGLSDLALVRKLINDDDLPPTESKGLRDQGYQRARELLIRHQQAIVTLAHKLAANGAITGSEFLELVSR
jgi:hypothetical protein